MQQNQGRQGNAQHVLIFRVDIDLQGVTPNKPGQAKCILDPRRNEMSMSITPSRIPDSATQFNLSQIQSMNAIRDQRAIIVTGTMIQRNLNFRG